MVDSTSTGFLTWDLCMCFNHEPKPSNYVENVVCRQAPGKKEIHATSNRMKTKM